MSKRQWGHGYHIGKHEILARLGLSDDVIRKIDDLKRRVEYHEDHFDSFDCDFSELQLRLGQLDLQALVYGTPSCQETLDACGREIARLSLPGSGLTDSTGLVQGAGPTA